MSIHTLLSRHSIAGQPERFTQVITATLRFNDGRAADIFIGISVLQRVIPKRYFHSFKSGLNTETNLCLAVISAING
jgi:hypothetical protein